MANWGLTSNQLKMLKETFARFPEVKEVRIFGSRAMGNYKPGSDVDLALYGDRPVESTTRIRAILNEELPLAFYFDVVDFNAVERPEFREHIRHYGQTIYRREQN